jgi:hypothetical protein
LRKVVVVLVVLAALGIVGDRLAARLVTDEAEQRLVAEGFSQPDVRMHGFPFLTQLAARTFTRVTVTSAGLETGEGRARAVRADLTDVHAPQVGPVTVGSLAATGTVPYDVVAQAVGSLQLAAGPAGQVEVARSVELAGQRFDVVAEARVHARGTRLRIVPTDLRVSGVPALGAQLRALLVDRMALVYDIPDLPAGVRVDEVTAGAEGFEVRATGRAVSVDAG